MIYYHNNSPNISGHFQKQKKNRNSSYEVGIRSQKVNNIEGLLLNIQESSHLYSSNQSLPDIIKPEAEISYKP
jgi:hypothetical protein